MHIPDGLRRTVDHHPAGPGWLRSLPALIDRSAARWDLVVGAPFTTGVAAWTAPARTRGGADVVLKISLPDEEARAEAHALRWWAGRGAVRLLGHAPEDWALLLERCRPGTALAADRAPDDERLRTGAGVLQALLASPAPPDATDVRPMAAVCLRGADVLLRTAAAAREEAAGHDRPSGTGAAPDDGLVREAAALLRELPGTGPTDVVVHGDLNPGNVLRAQARPQHAAGWLAIDPKPLRGDPAHDPWPLVAQLGAPFDGPDPVGTLRRRTALVADEAGLDVDRVRAWSFARSVQSAYWSVAEGRCAPAGAELARARVWGRLLG